MKPLIMGIPPRGQPSSMRKKIENYSYALTDRIGKGFSSVVFRGQDDTSKQTVAVKVIDLKSLDEVGMAMLQSEIKILKEVDHPNIIKCHNVYSTQNNCYIVTEFCKDGDLASWIKRQRRINQSQALQIFKQIVEGFAYFARKNIIHRDLKPANIFMNQGQAKIADFGFAKFCSGQPQRDKYNVGTPLYMAPQALSKNVYSVKNDIWGIGVILFQLLFGTTPWQSRSEKQLIDKLYRMPVQFRGPCSQQTKDFIRKCCQVDQFRRITVDQMVAHPINSKSQAPQNIKENAKKGMKTVVHFERAMQNSRTLKQVENKRNSTQQRPVRQDRNSEQQARQLRQMILNKRRSEEQNKQPIKKQAKPVKPVQKSQISQVKKLCKVIISVVNLCRYIFKFVKLQAHTIYQSYLHGLIKMLTGVIDGELKIGAADIHQEFRKWSGFSRYRQAIQEYWIKYKPYFQGTQPSLNVFQVQRKLVEDIQGCLNTLEGNKEKQRAQKISKLKYMVNLHGVNSILGVRRDYERLSREGQIQGLVQSKQECSKQEEAQLISRATMIC